jgi:1-acyl-sn-glycerol-3-phosphate acyltransferase
LNKRSVVIFPEGTRSKTGIPKPFAENGLKILCKYAPSAYIVPLTINNSWKMTRWGSFPLGVGNKLTFTVHTPLAVASMSFPDIFEKTEKAVTGAIRN